MCSLIVERSKKIKKQEESVSLPYKKEAIGQLQFPHSQFVLDKSIIGNSGGYYHKNRLQFLMEKELIKKDNELLKNNKEKLVEMKNK